MCYSFQTSIFSYSIGMLSAVFAMCTNQMTLGVLILFYTQMQLAEALIWKGIDTDNVELNKIGTAVAKYSLPSHVFAVGLGYLIAIRLQKKSYTIYDTIPLCLGILFYIIVLFTVYQQKMETTTFPKEVVPTSCQNPNNRLLWPFPHQKWYLVGFAICILTFLFAKTMKRSSKLVISSFFVLTFVASLVASKVTIGSFFCFSTAILAPFLVIINYFLV